MPVTVISSRFIDPTVLDVKHNNQYPSKAAYLWQGHVSLAAGVAVLNMNGYKITGSATTGLSGSDLVPYTVASSLSLSATYQSSWKFPVAYAPTVGAGNITLSGEFTLETFTSDESRVLLGFQTDPTENGIWVTGAGAWTRPPDFNTWNLAKNAIVAVDSLAGTTNSGKVFKIIALGSETLDTAGADITIAEFGAGGGGGGGIISTVSNGLVLSSEDLSVRLGNSDYAAPTLKFDATDDGLQVNLDTSGAIIGSVSGVRVNLGSASGLTIATNELSVLLKDASLAIDSSGIQVNLDTNAGILSDTGGLLVNTDDVSIIRDTNVVKLGINVQAEFPETFTLDSDIVNTDKEVTLTHTPISGPHTEVYVITSDNTVSHRLLYGLDYTLSGNTLGWNTLGLDGVLLETDKLFVQYEYNVYTS